MNIYGGALPELTQKEKDWRVGAVSGADRILLREDGDYRDFAPKTEYQGGVYFDSMSCVTFSAWNVIETIAKFMGLDWNMSDRFTSKMSGTTRQGNYLSTVADSICRFHGGVAEEKWPFPNKQREPVFDWDDFFADIPAALQKEGLKLLDGWKIQHEWVNNDQLLEMMKYGPQQVTVQAWPIPDKNGVYHNVSEQTIPYNHAVEVLYIKTKIDPVTQKQVPVFFDILDHYTQDRKILGGDYRFGAIKRFTLTNKSNQPMPQINLPNNCLVQMTGEGATGAFALHLDGKLLIGPAAEVLASWSIRSSSFDNKKAISKENWDSFPHFNLKLEPIN